MCSNKKTLSFATETVIILMIVLCLPATGMCHGTRGEKLSGGIGGRFTYSDGSPMSYCKTLVFKDDDKLPFQTGVTDRNGRFIIWPEKGHTFSIEVSDGIGHRHEIKITVPLHVTKDKERSGGKETEIKGDELLDQDQCIPFKAATGVGLILLLGCLTRFVINKAAKADNVK